MLVRERGGERRHLVTKEVSVRPDKLAEAQHEAKVLGQVSHSNIVKYVDSFVEDRKFYIVMELVSGGELFDRLVEYGAFSEREAAVLVQELGGAIALLHAQGLCHADIKPENLMLTDAGHVKLVDFGLSVDLNSGG